MITKYGEINNEQLIKCLDRYTNRIFQIIPMNENDDERKTLPIYVSSLIRELTGVSNIIFEEYFLSIVGTLKGLEYDNHDTLKSDVFKLLDIIKKLKKRVK